MDIYILRDGKEIGPFNEEATHTLLKQGSVLIADLAWRPGMPKWLPLHDVLYPPPPPPPPAHAFGGKTAEPFVTASDKQKAFLSYFGIPFASELSREEASRLVNDAMEDGKVSARLAQWNEDRLRLHPDLFAAEIQEKKENRATHFFEICQTEGAEYFTKVTKAHCQVLVGYLDVKFPNWDARESDAARHYFFPAIAEKFPQLVKREWKDKFTFAEGIKSLSKPNRGSLSAAPAHTKTRKSPVVAAARGVFFGALILGVLYLVWGVSKVQPKPKNPAAKATPKSAETVPAIPAESPGLAAAPVQSTGIPGLTEVVPETPAAVTPPAEPPVANPVTVPEIPGLSPDPASPVAPAPAPETPGAAGANPPPNPEQPADPGVAKDPTPPMPGATPAKTQLLLTKPVAIQLAYGKITLPPGTAVKLISSDGRNLRVSYLNSVITVPANSTDLPSGEVAPGVSPSPFGSPVPPAP